jgi:iron uptake system EfeUOB component EfeO/EfeM
VQWLDAGGTVVKAPAGCSYVLAETNQLDVYRAYVAAKLSTLSSQAATLSTAIGSGNLAQAQSAWLAAHLTWLDIGQDDGAYGCFGALGGDIDGLAAGHPLGTADPGFTGFHRIEFDLWSQHDLSAAARDTTTLQTLLAKLMRTPLSTYLPTTATGIGNWLLRPHEVIEDAIRDSLTADDDYGSATDLASLTADVAAVRVLLTELSPVLDPVAPGLHRQASRELNSLASAIEAADPGDASVSIADLPAGRRQQIDADADMAAEALAPIPDLITSTGRNSPAD